MVWSSRGLATSTWTYLLPLSIDRAAFRTILYSKRHFQSSSCYSKSASQLSVNSERADDPPEGTRRRKSPSITKSKREKKLFSDLPTRALGEDGTEMKPLEAYVQESKGNARRRKGSSNKSDVPTTSENEPLSSIPSSKSRRSKRLSSLASELGPTGQSWPPLAQQVLANLQAFPDCILLTRVGGFYESYFDQSSLISNLLGIKLANRTWGGRNVGMAGFPLQQLEKYLKILVQENGKLVAICEEFKEYEHTRDEEGTGRTTKKKKVSQLNESQTITRRVTRVVSPGTLIDEKFLDPFRNNYILAVSAIPKSGFSSRDDSSKASSSYDYGLAWLDLSTADFTTTVCHDSESLRDEIARITPREVILQPGIFDLGTTREVSRSDQDQEQDAEEVEKDQGEIERSDHSIWEVIDPGNVMISLSNLDLENPETNLKGLPTQDQSSYKVDGLDLDKPSYTLSESRAVSQLTTYLKTRLLDLTNSESGMELQFLASGSPMRRMREENMLIDAHTLSSLEIREAFRDGNVSHRGSLSSVMRGTVTRGGTRLLGEWLTSPSTSLSVIQARHSLVSLFLSRAFLRDDLRSTLRRGAGDISRVLQRITTRRNDEQDLLEIRDFIHTCQRIVIKLKEELKEIDDEISEADWDLKKRGSNPGSVLVLNQSKMREERIQTKASLETIVESFKDLSSLGRELGEAIDERVMEHRVRNQEAAARQMEEEVASSLDSSVVVGGSLGLGRVSDSLRSSEIVSGDVETGNKKRRKNGVVEERPELWGQDFEHLIRPSTSKVLQSLTDEYTRLRREARILEDDLRLRFGTDKVTLKHLLGQGYIVHLQDFRSRSSKESGTSITSIEHDLSLSLGYRGRTTRTYYYDIWTSLGSRISRLAEEIKNKENLELERLRMLSLTSVPQLRKNSRLIDQLDVLLGFSQLASEFNLVKPEMTNDLTFDIKGGRHLSVELGLLERGRMFQRNNCLLDYDRSRILFLSGPNMSGKSAFLRQNALIVILAQSGSFVPAEEAKIGIVDKVFSRVGAKDDLFRDRSTFMVEMQETGQILRRATPRSLVICDEIGRGTTSSVGLSIAFATLHELHHTNKCRTLFATHFHELADMLGWKEDQELNLNKTGFTSVDFFCTDVDESTPETITYSHSLRRGVNRESHGLKVAKLAEVPSRAVEVAEKTLAWLAFREDASRGDSEFSEKELKRLRESLAEKTTRL